ncbi:MULTISPECIES: 5'-3' exonuclease [Microbacterium]|uniref:5'-3' exonuclease n=1 Tax=Microbacterium TaxID=33882 RepID=UPI000E74A428|nr:MULTISPECIES: 5'-3' exonuclease [Microbacterium]RKE63503.1 5'-3' exonuclease [Microbacterium sp. AG238]WJM16862.1 5'-3' exonuclease [Microbacterium arborescens]
MSDRLMLLDSASLYFRAFYGVPDTVKDSEGRPVNAARGFLDMIAKLVATYEPTHLVACWDDDWRPQWRVDLIPTYKTHRVAETVETGPDVEVVPDPLEAQIPTIRESLEALGIPIVGAPHHEADDVIGTLATQATMPVDVVTGDRDLIQLVDDERDVRVIYTGRGMSNLDVLTGETVLAKYAVRPDQYADFATMRGDASDGLPGVAGVGDKTAATLLSTHGDLDGILAAAETGEGMTAGVRAKLAAAADYLAVAPQVVRVVRDLDLGVVDGRIRPTDPEVVQQLADRRGLGGSLARAASALRARA